MHEDVKWLFGIIIMFGLIWYVSFSLGRGVSSGTASSTSQRETYVPVPANGSAYYYGGGSGQVPQGARQSNQTMTQSQQALGALEKTSTASPLAGMLRIGNVSAGADTNGAYEYVVLQAAYNNTSAIYISGLRLQSTITGRGVDIPDGVYLPLQNSTNENQPIILQPGGVAYIMTGHSPLGYSFRPNECTGYFTQYQNFTPIGLPARCPAPSSESLPPPANQYDDACLDYLNSLPACRVVLNPPRTISPGCQTFVTTYLNYTQCVNRHKNDAGFYDNQWLVYLGRDAGLWKSRREAIQLIDKNGKIIDEITY